MNGTHTANRRQDGAMCAVGPAVSSLPKRRRWESNPLEAALQAAALPSGSSRHPVSSPGMEPGLRPSQGRVQDPPHSEDCFAQRPAEESNLVLQIRDCRAIRHTRRAYCQSVSTRNRTWIWTFGGSYAILCTIETFSVPTWSRTRARALGEPRAIRYTIGTDIPEPTTGFAPA